MPVNHSDILIELSDSQDAEKDMREQVREADLFLNKRDGQWEPKILQAMSNRPRYTFDQCNPVVDDIMGEMETTDFAIDVKPSGGAATKEMSISFGGIIRNIEVASKARRIYNQAGRKMTGTGLGGWRITQEFRDSDSFDQDLIIQSLSNFQDRVWFDQDAVEQDMSDSMRCWVLTSMTMGAYKKKWPKGSCMSIGDSRLGDAYNHKKNNEVIIGEYYHRVATDRELARMSNGAIYVIDDDFNDVYDELRASGVTIETTRTRQLLTTHHRIFDGNDWLNNDKKTVFEHIPVIPVYGNFDLSENKIVYWGSIEKLMDPQRVLNYAESKKTAESSLKPIEKTWVAKEQATSSDVKSTLETQNTNSDPVQFYDHAEGVLPPFKPQNPQPDSILIETAMSAQNYINKASGLHNAGRGIGEPNQAEGTVRLLQNKGDNSNYKYFGSMSVAITHTGNILLKAIPKVYNKRQEMTLIGEDGTQSQITIHEKIHDTQTNRIVTMNDLSKGSYSLSCSPGPAFANKQQETVTNIVEVGKVIPDVLEKGKDVLLANISAPGMNKVAERVRREMVLSGTIPPDQLTKEEKDLKAQMAQQGNQPSPIEQAQLGIAKAEMEKAQAMTADTMSKMEERQNKAAAANKEAQLKMQKMILDYQASQEKRQDERDKNSQELILNMANQLKVQTETLKNLKDILGADGIVGPEIIKTFVEQVGVVNDNQNNQ